MACRRGQCPGLLGRASYRPQLRQVREVHQDNPELQGARVPLTQAFPLDVSDDQIRSLKLRRPIHVSLFVDIYEAARARGLTESWLTELKQAIDQGVQA